MRILQTDPRAGYLAQQKEIDEAVLRTLAGGMYILGEEVAKFEAEFAAFIGVNHAIGVANGTDALELALRVCGIGHDDLVFTVSNTAVATVAAIELVGAIPVFVDVHPERFTMDPDALEVAIGKFAAASRRHAVIPVHLFGQPADMPAIMQVAQRHGFPVIEDCAQSHGAKIGEKVAGAWGDCAAFSFYPTKNLGAFGDGGALLTNNARLNERGLMLRQYGWRERYISDEPGMNTRLDELHAAVLRVKLKRLGQDNEARRSIAKTYSNSLNSSTLALPESGDGVFHVYHQYVIRHDQRDDLRNFLSAKGIGTGIHYPMPIHFQPAYAGRVTLGADELPVTEHLANQILSLPMYPHLTEQAISDVCTNVLRWVAEHDGA